MEEDFQLFQKADVFHICQLIITFHLESGCGIHYLDLLLMQIQLITNQLIMNHKSSAAVVSYSMDSFSSFSSRAFTTISPSLLFCISSITSLLFSILKSISNLPSSTIISSDTIKVIVSMLCILLPYSDYAVTEWIELLINCYSFVNTSTQVEVLKAIRLFVLQINEKDTEVLSNKQDVINRLFNVFLDCFMPLYRTESVYHLFHRQQEMLFLLRSLLAQPLWNSVLLSTIQAYTVSSDLSYAIVFATASLFGGELIGIFEGCQGVFYSKKPVMTEKTGIHEIYTDPEKCEVLRIFEDREYVQIQILRTKEIREVPFVSVDYVHPSPVTLLDLSPTIVSWLFEMYIQIQAKEFILLSCIIIENNSRMNYLNELRKSRYLRVYLH